MNSVENEAKSDSTLNLVFVEVKKVHRIWRLDSQWVVSYIVWIWFYLCVYLCGLG